MKRYLILINISFFLLTSCSSKINVDSFKKSSALISLLSLESQSTGSGEKVDNDILDSAQTLDIYSILRGGSAEYIANSQASWSISGASASLTISGDNKSVTVNPLSDGVVTVTAFYSSSISKSVTLTIVNNKIHSSNLITSSSNSTSFQSSIDFAGDKNTNATATLYYCNKSLSSTCDPLAGDSVSLSRSASNFSSLITVGVGYNPGDTIGVIVVTSDADGVTSNNLESTVILSSVVVVPMPDPTISISSGDTSSTSYLNITDANTAVVSLGNIGTATKYCLSESNSTAPASTANGTCDGGNWLTSAPTSFNFSAGEGSKTVYTWVANTSESINPGPISDTIVIDNTIPTTPSGFSNGAVPATYTSSPTISWTGDSTDTNSILKYQIQIIRTSDSVVMKAWADFTKGSSVSGLALAVSTQYTASIKSFDSALNESLVATHNWTTPAPPPMTDPTISISSGDTSSTSYLNITDANTAVVSLGSIGTATKYCLSESNSAAPASTANGTCDGGNWVASAPTSFNFSAGEGSKTVYIWVANSAETINPGPISDTIVIDNTKPTIPSGLSTGAVPAGVTTSPTFTWTTNSTDTNSIAKYQIKITRTSDSAVMRAWADFTKGFSVTGLTLASSTQYTAAFRAVDSAGNLSSEGNINWTTAPPPALLELTPKTSTRMDITGGVSPGSNVTLTLTNNGGSISSTLLSPSFSGNTSNFEVVTDNCIGNTLIVAASCTVIIRPKATSNGFYSASISISDGSVSGSATINGSASGFAIIPAVTSRPILESTETHYLPSGLLTDTVTHNVPASSDRVLVVFIGKSHNNYTVDTMQFAGDSLTQLSNSYNSSYASTEIWYLKNPKIGDWDLVINKSTISLKIELIALNFSNVDLSTTFGPTSDRTITNNDPFISTLNVSSTQLGLVSLHTQLDTTVYTSSVTPQSSYRISDNKTLQGFIYDTTGAINPTFTAGSNKYSASTTVSLNGETQRLKVSSVSTPNADSTYSAPDSIDIEINFPEAVTVTGSPKILLSKDNSFGAYYAQYLSGSSSNTLVFRYNVGKSHFSDKLDVISFDLTSGTIKDSSLREIDLYIPTGTNPASLSSSYDIKIQPTIPSIIKSEELTTSSSSLSHSLSYTNIAATNSTLVITLHERNQRDWDCTYNGVPLTKELTSSYSWTGVSLYYLQNPPIGTFDIDCSSVAGSEFGIQVFTVMNTRQATESIINAQEYSELSNVTSRNVSLSVSPGNLGIIAVSTGTNFSSYSNSSAPIFDKLSGIDGKGTGSNLGHIIMYEPQASTIIDPTIYFTTSTRIQWISFEISPP